MTEHFKEVMKKWDNQIPEKNRREFGEDILWLMSTVKKPPEQEQDNNSYEEGYEDCRSREYNSSYGMDMGN